MPEMNETDTRYTTLVADAIGCPEKPDCLAGEQNGECYCLKAAEAVIAQLSSDVMSKPEQPK